VVIPLPNLIVRIEAQPLAVRYQGNQNRGRVSEHHSSHALIVWRGYDNPVGTRAIAGATTLGAMILSDRTLREEIAAGRIVIDPFEPANVQPSSIDLRIDRYFRVFRNHTTGIIDVKENQENLTELVEIGADDVFILHPGEFVLGSTAERVSVPDDLVARIEGKSSLGRLGVVIHSTAGFIDPGFNGHITLELSNAATLPITLYPGMKIGQVSFLRMTTPADHPYGSSAIGSKYQGQRGPTPSRYFENFRK
jgi:dCTP deaminase